MKRQKLVLFGVTMAALVATHATQAGPMIELIENGEFENHDAGPRWINSGWNRAGQVPGWWSNENHIEIWKQGFLRSPTRGTDGNFTGYHAELTGDDQEGTVFTSFITPDWLLPDSGAWLTFDFWNRNGSGLHVNLETAAPRRPLPWQDRLCEAVDDVLVDCEPASDDPAPERLANVFAPQSAEIRDDTKKQWMRHEEWFALLPGTQYTLSFTGLGGGTSGAHIDQVSLQVASADVPAPAPAALLALGLAVLRLRRRGR